MLKVVGCFVEAHDLRLVALAALVCSLASISAIELLRHALRSKGALKTGWLAIAAIAGGSGIWATHFIAMLAFEPSLPSAYDLGLTILSLVLAILCVGTGFAVATSKRSRFVAAGSGAIVGGGIAAMHYTGMTAFEIAGRLSWDPTIVAVSIAFAAVLGALALTVALSGRALVYRALGSVLLLLAIVSHHFTAMGAATIVPDPTIVLSASAVPSHWLAIAVALASSVILLLSVAALMLDLRERRHVKIAGERLRSLANAAVEGLVVCRGDRIVSANDSFAALAGIDDAENLTGEPVSRFLPGTTIHVASPAQAEQVLETHLSARGEAIPVELIIRPIHYANEPHYAMAIRDLRARRRSEKQIQFLAHHDALTGLANRASFNKRLDHELKAAAQRGGKLAVLCLDLDRFKEVNDLFGHATGDDLLRTVARTVTDILDEDQLMARLGGDEFAVLAPCDHAVTAGRLTERILDALQNANSDGRAPPIASSVGIALFPDDAGDRNTLLNHADTALYRAKADGRGTYRFFEAKMGIEVRDRRLLEHDLRHAVARGEMSLVFQPQKDLRAGRVIGFEALLRWQHPVRGTISPADFIPIAEETGLILHIGEWVLAEACRTAAGWDEPLAIAVNVSGVQVHNPRFAQSVHETLFETGLKPERLEIEITETALIREPARALHALRQVKALGVKIAMDDFGTGYSSLSNLKTFPFDRLKIDRSFIKAVQTNDQAAAIVRSVLGLGRGLGLPVVAEGVETQEELDFLTAERCDAAQGYLIGRPGPIGGFVDRTADDTPAVRAAA